MSEKEITFENAKMGDKVFSPLFRWEIGQKTNAVVKRSVHVDTVAVQGDGVDDTTLFANDGSFGCGWKGQVLFWENPIKEIPVRPKRKVKKTGYMAITPVAGSDRRIAHTSNVYDTPELATECIQGENSQIITVEFETEE